MYNKQLETFLKVAAFGSFSAAAETMYISPSAVIQQMNALEDELKAKLFVRTRKGVLLTEAGKYLHSEAADYIRKGNSICSRLEMLSRGDRPISVGTNEDYKVNLLYDLWTMYIDAGGTEEISLNIMSSSVEDTADYDLVEGLRSAAVWQANMHFEPLCEVSLGLGMRYDHPLVSRDVISIEDLRPYTLLVSKDVVPPLADGFFKKLREHQVYHEVINSYEANIIWQLSRRQQLIVIPSHRFVTEKDIVYRPVEEPFMLSYGIFYHQPFTGPERGFIDYILSLKAESTGTALFDSLFRR